MRLPSQRALMSAARPFVSQPILRGRRALCSPPPPLHPHTRLHIVPVCTRSACRCCWASFFFHSWGLSTPPSAPGKANHRQARPQCASPLAASWPDLLLRRFGALRTPSARLALLQRAIFLRRADCVYSAAPRSSRIARRARHIPGLSRGQVGSACSRPSSRLQDDLCPQQPHPHIGKPNRLPSLACQKSPLLRYPRHRTTHQGPRGESHEIDQEPCPPSPA